MEVAFCSCAYTLYSEIDCKISELDWLLLYARCCEELLSREFMNYKAKPDFYRKLGAEFVTETVINLKDYMSESVLEDLREILYEEYALLFNNEE